MTIRDLARPSVVTVTPDTPVSDAAATMADERVGSVVVVEPDGTPVGIVTDRDLALDVLGVGIDPGELTARELMSEDLFTVEADAEVFDVIAEMCEVGVRRVPVVENGSLVGIVTLDDFMVVLAGEMANLAGVIGADMPPYE